MEEISRFIKIHRKNPSWVSESNQCWVVSWQTVVPVASGLRPRSFLQEQCAERVLELPRIHPREKRTETLGVLAIVPRKTSFQALFLFLMICTLLKRGVFSLAKFNVKKKLNWFQFNLVLILTKKEKNVYSIPSAHSMIPCSECHSEDSP